MQHVLAARGNLQVSIIKILKEKYLCLTIKLYYGMSAIKSKILQVKGEGVDILCPYFVQCNVLPYSGYC
jgi:hypothetical protein